MKILAIDGSSNVSSVAIVSFGKILGDFTTNNKRTHSTTLMPMIDNLLSVLDINIKDIDYIATNVGPGSFTGLRIAIATAKGLAYSLNIPVIQVPTLDSLAYNITLCDTFVVPIMDARRGEVYTAYYRKNGGITTRLSDYLAINIQTVMNYLEENEHKAIFVGDGVEAHKELIKENNHIIAPEEICFQKATSVGLLAFNNISSATTYDQVSPIYIRKPQAEREYEKQNRYKTI